MIKRVKLSIIGGVMLPFLYAVLLSVLSNLADRTSVVGIWFESAEAFLKFPINWTTHVYFYFYPPDPDFSMFTGLELGNILSLVVGNFLLYSILSYAVCARFDAVFDDYAGNE